MFRAMVLSEREPGVCLEVSVLGVVRLNSFLMPHDGCRKRPYHHPAISRPSSL